jgi:phenylalanyl-tRNA synthetase beta chain
VTTGKISTKLARKMDIKQDVFFADFHWDTIVSQIQIDSTRYKPVNRFPRIRRDLALVLDRSIQYEALSKVILKNGKSRLKSVNLFDVFNDEKVLGEGKVSYAVSLIFQDPEKTMSDKEVDSIVSYILKKLERTFNARLR